MNEQSTKQKESNFFIKTFNQVKQNPTIHFLIETIVVFLFVSLIIFLAHKFTSKDDEKVFEKVLELIIILFISIASVYINSLRKLKKTLLTVKTDIETKIETIKDDISYQNDKSNKAILKIATKDIEEKIYRKLISTNAIIPDNNNKLSITARILNDFPDENEYKDIPIDKEKTISIDFVRFLSYQNLLLTPKYLEYFFYRKDSVKKAIRIIALPTGHNESLCQATLTYIFLSARYGYETYIIPEQRFKAFVKLKCSNDIELKKMIKGNPFILKVKNGEKESYIGEYIDYQENIENNGKNINANNKESWDILLELKKYSRKIVAKSTGFEEYIKSNIISLNRHQIE